MRDAIERDLGHIENMLERLYRIGEYLQTLHESGFSLNDEMVIDLMAFQLVQVGEELADGKLSADTRQRFPRVPWREMKKQRNFVAHSYARKRNSVLVKIVEQDVPAYIEELQGVRRYLLDELEEGSDDQP